MTATKVAVEPLMVMAYIGIEVNMWTAPQTAEVFDTDQGQAVRLPPDYRFTTASVTVRCAGESIILEPIRLNQWPPGFFDSVAIDDPAFERPEQGHFTPLPDSL